MVNDVPIPNKGMDMKKLEGQGAYQTYNAHYIPVISTDPKSPDNMVYHPCHHTEQPAWDEYVVFHSTQALARFVVELDVDLPVAPSVPTFTLGTLIDQILVFLDKPAVQNDREINNWLSAKVSPLLKLNSQNPLSSNDVLLYNCVTKLFDQEGKIRPFIKQQLLQFKSSENVVKSECDAKSLSANANSSDFSGNLTTVPPILALPVNLKDMKDKFPIHTAAQEGNVEKIQQQLKTNPNSLESRNELGETPLIVAVSHGHAQACAALLKAGADFNATDPVFQQNVLYLACRAGAIEIVRIFSAYKQLLEFKAQDEWTPLLVAVYHGHTQVCEILLKAGADINVTDSSSGRNALHFACIRGHIEVVRLFAKYSHLRSAKDKKGSTPLALAQSSKKTEIAELLQKEEAAYHVFQNQSEYEAKSLSANANSSDFSGNSTTVPTIPVPADNLKDMKDKFPLHTAAQEGNVEKIQQQLKTNPHLLESRNDHGETPLIVAASHGHAQVCKILLKAEANLNATNPFQRNALHVACRAGQIEVVRILSAYKQLLESKAQDELTPLLVAAWLGHVQVCAVLLEAGADINAIHSSGKNALHLACEGGDIKVVQLFAKYRHLRIAKDKKGSTPLILAQSFKKTEIAKLLQKEEEKIHQELLEFLCSTSIAKSEYDLKSLSANANSSDSSGNLTTVPTISILPTNLKDMKNELSLHAAAEEGNVEKIQQQLKINPNSLESRNKNGDTPLIVAASYGHAIVCAVLLKAGANVNATNRFERNALYSACKAGKIEVVQILSTYKQLLESRAQDGLTPLLVAAWLGHAKICAVLLEAGADINAIDFLSGKNALHLACGGRDIETVRLLVKYKQLRSAKDKKGSTPLTLAQDLKKTKIAEILQKEEEKSHQESLEFLSSANITKSECEVKSLSANFNSSGSPGNLTVPATPIPPASAMTQISLKEEQSKTAASNSPTSKNLPVSAQNVTDIYASSNIVKFLEKTPIVISSKPVTSPSIVFKYFGKKQWTKYFGDIGNAPPLPANIYTILRGPCPFFKGEKVANTHVLVLIPKTINGKNLTLNSIEELVKHPEGDGRPMHYWDLHPVTASEYGGTGIAQSHWVLMTKDIIPVSRKQPYKTQMKLIADYKGYSIPDLVEITAAILMTYVSTGVHLCCEEDTWIRCDPDVQKTWSLHVGWRRKDSTSYQFEINKQVSHSSLSTYGVVAVQRF